MVELGRAYARLEACYGFERVHLILFFVVPVFLAVLVWVLIPWQTVVPVPDVTARPEYPVWEWGAQRTAEPAWAKFTDL